MTKEQYDRLETAMDGVYKLCWGDSADINKTYNAQLDIYLELIEYKGGRERLYKATLKAQDRVYKAFNDYEDALNIAKQAVKYITDEWAARRYLLRVAYNLLERIERQHNYKVAERNAKKAN